MAMEYKTLNVKNSEEDSTIAFWTQFGWSLKSSQRVYNKDSHIETDRGTGDLCSVTETVDFTKLVFERDKSMPGYADVVRLEEEYFSAASELSKFGEIKKPAKMSIKSYSTIEEYAKGEKPDLRKGGWVTTILCVLLACATVAGLFIKQFILSAVCAVAFVTIFVVVEKIKSKRIAEAFADRNGALYAKMTEKYKKHQERYESEAKAHSKDMEKYQERLNRRDFLGSRLQDIPAEIERLMQGEKV